MLGWRLYAPVCGNMLYLLRFSYLARLSYDRSSYDRLSDDCLGYDQMLGVCAAYVAELLRRSTAC